MSVVGFDFGTQFCYIAVARGGGIDVIANDYSLRNTASVVALLENSRIVGQSAKQQQVTNIKNTVYNFKKLIGRKFEDAQVQKEIARLPYEIIKQSDGSIGIKVSYLGEDQVFSPESITATMFTKLKEITEVALGKPIYDCVIAVPMFFTDAERRAIQAVAQIAGLNCLKILNETTATALTYGIYKQDLPPTEEKPRNVAFIDIGNSSTQCCICQFNKGKLKVIAGSYDPQLGGRDFDDVLKHHFCEEFKTKYKIDAASRNRAWLRLGDECEKLKKLMTGNTNHMPLNIECFMDDKDVTSKIKRSEFEAMCVSLLSRVETTMCEVLKVSKLKPEDIYAVEIVGGSTRIPAIKDLVQKVFKQPPSTTLNADEAVARGAALQCAILSPTFRVREFSVTDYQPYSITLAWVVAGGVESMEIFEAGHAFPFSKILTFYRKEPFTLVAQYTDPKSIPYPDQNIGKFTICDVSRGEEEESAKVKVKLRININGLFLASSASFMEKVVPVGGGEKEEGEEQMMEEDGSKVPVAENTPEADTNGQGTPDADNNMAVDGEVNDTSAAGDSAAINDEHVQDGVNDIEAGDKEKNQDTKDKSPKKGAAKQAAKPKMRSIDLPIQSFTHQMPADKVRELYDLEMKMIAHDKSERERSFAKNSLEEFVYELRGKLGEEYEKFILPKEKDKLLGILNDTENWLYDEGENEAKKVYEDKLLNLKSMTHDMQLRYSESMKRPEAFEALGKRLQQGLKFLEAYKAKDERYDHLSPEEVDKVKKCVGEKQKWFDEKSSKQASLKPHETPYVLTDQIYTELKALDSLCNPIVNKPKPKVEPPPEEKVEEEKVEEEKPVVEGGGQAPAEEENVNMEPEGKATSGTAGAPSEDMEVD